MMLKNNFFISFFFVLNIFSVTIVFAQKKANANGSRNYSLKNASITINIENAKEMDSLTLYYYDNVLSRTSSHFFPRRKIYSTLNSKGELVFKIPSITKPAYFSLTNKIIRNEQERDIEMLGYYLVEPGDDVKIDVRRDSVYTKTINKRGFVAGGPYYYGLSFFPNYSFYFSGRGSKKYECRYEADRITSSGAPDLARLAPDEPAFGKRQMASIKISLDMLSKYRSKINPLAYEIIKADFIGHFEGSWYDAFRMAFMSSRMTDSVYKHYYITALNKKNKKPLTSFSQPVNEISANYGWSIMQKEKVNNLQKVVNNLSGVYDALKENYKGLLLDKAITVFLFENSSNLPDLPFLLDDAFETVQTNYFTKRLLELKSNVAKNSPAYEFALPDTSGNIVKLSDFKGKVVFMDFWFNRCGACKEYYIYQLKGVEEKYRNNKDVVFVTVNIDVNKQVWLDGIYDNQHTSLDAINLYTEGLGADHPIIQNYKIIGYPRPILIDQSGKLFSVISKDLLNGKKLAELIDELLKSQAINQTD